MLQLILGFAFKKRLVPLVNRIKLYRQSIDNLIYNFLNLPSVHYHGIPEPSLSSCKGKKCTVKYPAAGLANV